MPKQPTRLLASSAASLAQVLLPDVERCVKENRRSRKLFEESCPVSLLDLLKFVAVLNIPMMVAEDAISRDNAEIKESG